jgi:chemotaxis response regulator CheB
LNLVHAGYWAVSSWERQNGDWSTMKRIRVLVANQPRLMRELIMATIADQPDIDLVGEVGKTGELADAVAQSRPDVLIVAMDEGDKDPAQYGFLLGRYPEMKIIALAPEKNRAQFYWAIVDIRSKSLESSEDGILNAMRQSAPLVGVAQV